MSKKGPAKKLMGPFIALIELNGTNKKRRGDADNRIKAVLDYATRIELIEDDRFAEWVVVGWISDPETAPVYGCRLTILPYDQKKGLPFLAALLDQ